MINKIGKFKITTYPPPLNQITNGAICYISDNITRLTSYLSKIERSIKHDNSLFLIDIAWIRKNAPIISSVSTLFSKKINTPIVFNSVGCSNEEIQCVLNAYDSSDTNELLFVFEIKNDEEKFLAKKKYSFSSSFDDVIKYLSLKNTNSHEETNALNKKINPKTTILRSSFIISTTIMFVVLSLFGSSLQSIRLSAVLESMTYFMSTQNENARIHSAYMKEYGDEIDKTATSQSIYSTYQQMQTKGSRYQYNNYIETYLLSGKNNDPIEYEATLDGYDNYDFSTKIIGLSAYSNQNRVLMETIRLEQYLITKNSFYSPLNGAESVYFMPSHIADYLIDISAEDNIANYTDLIGKKVTLSFAGETDPFNIVMSINNIFYTTYNKNNIGTPFNADDIIHEYNGNDKDFGKYLTDTIGDFGVSTTRRAHQTFGTTFCFDFQGRNRLLTMLIDDILGKNFTSDGSYLDFYYERKPVIEYGIELYNINDLYSEPQNVFFGANYVYLGLSFLFLAPSVISYVFLYRDGEAFLLTTKKKKTRDIGILAAPLFVVQFSFLILLWLFGHTSYNISLLNTVGSGISLLFTLVISLIWVFKKSNYMAKYQLKRMVETHEIYI